MKNSTFKVMRKSLGLSLADIAIRLDLNSRRSVHRWETRWPVPEEIGSWYRKEDCEKQLGLNIDEQDAYLEMIFTILATRGITDVEVVDRKSED